MFVTLPRLRELCPKVTVIVSDDGSTITINELPFITDGRKGIKCPKGWSVSAFGNFSVTINGPNTYDSPEHVIASCGIQFDMHKPTTSNPMARLPSASKRPTTVPPRHVPVATVNDDGTITVTVCVSIEGKECFGNLVPKVITMSNALCGDITFQPASVTYQGNVYYSLKLQDGSVLCFIFHRDIAKEAMGLLQKARDDAAVAEGRANIQQKLLQGLIAMRRDSIPRANDGIQRDEPVTCDNVIPYSPFDGQIVVSNMFGDDAPTENWSQDVDDAAPASAAPAAHAAHAAPAPPAPASAPLPRDKEANALSGALDVVLTQDDQKALNKAKRAVQKAKHSEQQRQTEEAEARRLQDLADIARVEQERKEAAAKAQCNALNHEFQSIEPVVQEEKSSVTIHTKHLNHIYGLRSQAQKLGIILPVYQNGNHWCIDILANQLFKLKVFRWNQYIWVSAIEDGFKVQVGRNSYPALMEIMPDVASIVQEAMELQETLDHRKQGLLPQPYCLQYYPCQAMGAYPLVPVPVYGPDGVIMAFQYVASPPLYA